MCGWHGAAFEGFAHSESMTCPSCNSSARDRYLYRCFVERVPYRRDLRVLETSPRLGGEYRRRMVEVLDYTSSDFDEKSHRGDLVLDLQDIALPDGSFDVVLTSHVLEHVPNVDRAMSELHRVLVPAGKMFVMVPLQQGFTGKPPCPEYHEDETLVHWRFGLDLTDRLQGHGFDVRVLVTEAFVKQLSADTWFETPEAGFDLESIREAVDPSVLEVVADERASRRLGFDVPFLFVAWEAVRR